MKYNRGVRLWIAKATTDGYDWERRPRPEGYDKSIPVSGDDQSYEEVDLER